MVDRPQAGQPDAIPGAAAELAFACLPKLWPVRADLTIQVELAALEQEKNAGGDHSLRPREDQLHRVFLPRRWWIPMHESAPQVGDRRAVNNRSERRAGSVIPGDLGGEGLANRFKPGRDPPAYHDTAVSSATSNDGVSDSKREV